MSDPAVAAAIAAGNVPDDITADYLNETRDPPTIAAIVVVTALTALIVGCRAISRALLVKRFGFDDALAVFGLLLLVAFVVLCIVLIKIGSGRHYEYIMYVMSMQAVRDSEVLDFAAHLVYTTALLVCRISGLAFYYRLCSLHDTFLLAIKIVAGVLVAGFLPQVFLIIFHCLPVTGLWPYDWQPEVADFTCLQWGIVYCTNSAVSLLCDLLLFGIPIAMLKILALSRKRKIQLGCILLPGILVIAISITRLVLVVKGQWESDMSWTYNPMLAVEVSEIGATLIALSVPGIKPLLDKCFGGSSSAQNTHGSKTTGAAYHPEGGNDTALQTIGNLRPTRSMVASGRYQTNAPPSTRDDSDPENYGGKDDNESTDGILVKVDFKVKEEYGRPQFDQKNQYRQI
ncbi:hypothetical protein MKZ38_009339 [Zalerion maritima]|uniref:Rhodopsin domain-containing protein n=1 Tax=Zalerion maritima TaxID=339359 RepID=A0AAD5RTH0_9PEZI|nr:hypothetical protein MKZ38_009339 [Zalerion maritima]